MDPSPDALIRLIVVLCALLVIVSCAWLTMPACGHAECHVLCDRLSHADRVREVTKHHASHTVAYPQRDCTACRPVDPGG